MCSPVLWRRAWALLLCLLALAVLPAHAVTVVDEAQALILREGHAPLTKTVRLPFHWDAHYRHDHGRAHLKLDLPPASAPEEALYIRRIGNTFRMTVDGEPFVAMGEAGNLRHDYGKQPRLFRLPPAPPGPPRRLEIEIEAQAAHSGGLSAVLLGPRDEIEEIYKDEYFLRVTLYLVVALVSAVLGTVALLIWLRQRDRLFLIYAIAEFLWAFQMLDVHFDQTPLPWPWWGILVLSARGLAAMAILKFVLGVMGREKSWLGLACNALLIAMVPALALAVTGVVRELEVWMRFAVELLLLASAFHVIRHGWRSPLLERRILAYSMVGIVLVLLRDLLVLVVLPYTLPSLLGVGTWANHYGHITWSRYGWMLFGFALIWVIAERMRRTSAELKAANTRLAQRLAQREAELSAAYAREAEAERQRATLEERQRLMRDIHDGLGSQLVGAMQLAHDSDTPRPVLTRALQDAVDNLKLTVDAMQDTEGDLAALLGALRYRLAPRLKAAGVELAWEVAPLPQLAGWSIQHSRHLQMILFEAFSNLLTHAAATRASLSAHRDADRVRVALADNGRGMAVGEQAGQGLANMHARAAALGAQLSFVSDGEGTRVELCLPLQVPGL